MTDEIVVPVEEWTLNGGPVNFTWRGMLLGPGLIKHELLRGRDDRPGIHVLKCVICAGDDIRILEQLVRPGWADEYRDLSRRPVFQNHVPAQVVGWVTSCGHVVWAGDWELVQPGPHRLTRWESRDIPLTERDLARYAAFARGEQ